MRIFKVCLLAAAAMGLVAAGFAHAGIENAGTTAANFLTVGAGPRVLSMGGATLGLGDDLTGVSWNAAALGWATNREFVLSHAGLENESFQEWAAMGGRFGSSRTRWAVSGLYQGDGSFEGRDASNNPTGTFTASSMALGTHVAHQFGRSLTLGLGMKSVMERLGDVSGFGFTFDGGVMYRTGPIGVGLAVQNFGGQMKFGGLPYSFPTNYGGGLSYALPGTGLKFALDANFPKAYYHDVRFGAEWVYQDMLAVRMGYRHEMSEQPDVLSGPTFGLGAGRNGFWFDYGYLVSSEGESTHRLGLKLLPGAWGGAGALGSQTRPEPVRTPKPKKVKKLVETPPPAAPAVAPVEKPAETQAAPPPEKQAAPVKPKREKKAADAPVEKAVEIAKDAVIAKAPPAAEKPAAPAPPPVRPTKIKVKAGETLAGIAAQWNVSVPALMMENDLVSNQVRVGMVLKLPPAGR